MNCKPRCGWRPSVVTAVLFGALILPRYTQGSETPVEIPAHRAQQIRDAAPGHAPVEPEESRRVLVFLTPPHLMPKDPHKGYCIPYGAHALKTLGEKTGAYAAVVSDDLAMFLPDRISQFDAIVLNNTSQAWIRPTEEQVASEPFRAQRLGCRSGRADTARKLIEVRPERWWTHGHSLRDWWQPAMAGICRSTGGHRQRPSLERGSRHQIGRSGSSDQRGVSGEGLPAG